MKVPKKITPDRIKDAIIEVRYVSQIPFDALPGIFYSAVVPEFKYSNRPIGRQQFSGAFPTSQEITLSLGGLSIFHNDNIKIQLLPNSIIFNCLEVYVGWDIYRKEIARVLSLFSKSVALESYSRIGMRYITEYPNFDLANIARFSFTFGLPGINSDSYAFRSEFHYEGSKVILNLNSKLLIIQNTGSPVPTSLIDIDVIEENLNETNFDSLMSKLDNIHRREKDLFFSITKDEFIQTLNPEY